MPRGLISGQMCPVFTPPTRAGQCPSRSEHEIDFEEAAARWQPFGAKVRIQPPCSPAVRVAISRFVDPVKIRKRAVRWCNKPKPAAVHSALALRRNQTLLTLHSLNMLHSRGFLGRVFGILAA